LQEINCIEFSAKRFGRFRNIKFNESSFMGSELSRADEETWQS